MENYTATITSSSGNSQIFYVDFELPVDVTIS